MNSNNSRSETIDNGAPIKKNDNSNTEKTGQDIILTQSSTIFKNPLIEKRTEFLITNAFISPDMGSAHIKQNHELYYFLLFDFNQFLVRASQTQIEEIFHIMCQIKEVSIETQKDLTRLFNFANHVLCIERDGDEGTRSYTLERLQTFLTFDNILNQIKRRDIQHEYRLKVKEFLKTLTNYHEGLSKQDEEAEQEYRPAAFMIMDFFKHLPVHELLANKSARQILYSVIQSFEPHGKLSHNEVVKNILVHLKYNNAISETKEKELQTGLNYIMTHPAKEHEEFSFNQQFLQAILQKNESLFFDSLEFYISLYIREQSRVYHVENELSLDEKIELFYGPYFSMIQPYYSNSLIEFLLENYDKTLFFKFMKHYNVPFNIPIKHDEDFISLLDYACIHKNLTLLHDLQETDTDFNETFFHKAIINEEIVSYEFDPKKSKFHYPEDVVIFMIEQNVINEYSIWGHENIFASLLKNNYYHAFLYLYRHAKSHNSQFSLNEHMTQDTLYSIDLLSVYLITKPENTIHPEVIELFVKEKFDLTHINEDKTTALDILQKESLESLTQLVHILEPIFPVSYKQEQKIEPVHVDTPVTPDMSMVSWYRHDQLMQHLKDSSGSRTKYLQKMLEGESHLKRNLLIENEDFFDTLLAQLPNFEEVIRYYKGQFRLKRFGKKTRINPILLLGEPGIGKTYFSKKLAGYLNTGYAFIDMGSMSASWVLSGMNGTWHDAKQGKIIDIMMASPSVNPVVLLDELDKAGGNQQYDSTVVLHQLLEEVNAREFTDEFLDFSFDVSGIIYIACANQLAPISDPIISRFKVFNVPSPTNEQLDSIIDNIYHDAIANNPLFEAELPHTLRDNLKHNSLREVKVMVEEAISNALLTYQVQDIEAMIVQGEKIVLQPEYFREKIKKGSIGF